MRKFLTLAAIAFTNIVIAHDSSSYTDSYQADYATVMDSLQKNSMMMEQISLSVLSQQQFSPHLSWLISQMSHLLIHQEV